MSGPTDTTEETAAKTSDPSHAKIRAWLDKMLPALGIARAETLSSGVAVEPAIQAAPVLHADFVSRQAEELVEQQRKNLDKAREDVAKKFKENEAKKTPQAPEDEWPALQFPKLEPPILDADVELRENADHAKLPKDLKSKMQADVWHNIRGQQSVLIAIYLRLKSYGIWDEVKVVKGKKEQLPWHGQLGPLVFGVHGTGGIAFEAHNPTSLMKKLVDTGHFGKDNVIMNFFHRKQTSYREWDMDQKIAPGVLENSIHEWNPKDPYPPSSLHISVGPGAEFDAHIDRVSPVMKPVEGHTVPDLTRGPRHWQEEVLGPSLGGVRPDVKVDKLPVGPREEKRVTTYTLNLELEWDFPGTNKHKERKVVNPHPPRPEPPPLEVHKKIMARVKQSVLRFPKTAEGNELDTETIAEIMAGRVLEAAKKGRSSVAFDIFDYRNTPLTSAEQQTVLNVMQQISRIVSGELGELAANVRGVKVRIAAHQDATVPIAE